MHNGDLNQSVAWLTENGRNETESIRRGQLQEVWGLEGVDFYQSVPPRHSAAAAVGKALSDRPTGLFTNRVADYLFLLHFLFLSALHL